MARFRGAATLRWSHRNKTPCCHQWQTIKHTKQEYVCVRACVEHVRVCLCRNADVVWGREYFSGGSMTNKYVRDDDKVKSFENHVLNVLGFQQFKFFNVFLFSKKKKKNVYSCEKSVD